MTAVQLRRRALQTLDGRPGNWTVASGVPSTALDDAVRVLAASHTLSSYTVAVTIGVRDGMGLESGVEVKLTHLSRRQRDFLESFGAERRSGQSAS